MQNVHCDREPHGKLNAKKKKPKTTTIRCDVYGPMSKELFGWFRYVILFTDGAGFLH